MGGCSSTPVVQPPTRPSTISSSSKTAPSANNAKATSAKKPKPRATPLVKGADPLPPKPPQDAPEKTPVNFILNLTDNKPLDASDITNLESAKHDLRMIRKYAKEFLDNIDIVPEDANEEKYYDDKSIRGALYDKQDFSSFKKVNYEKSPEVRTLIYDSIKPNVLFEHDTKEEILQIIDVFKPRTYRQGQKIIEQGDEGSEFYVVESGELSVHVTVKGGDNGNEEGESSQLKVGDYSKGSAFGELALIFGSPRAATITATSDCKLWSIERMAYRSVISQLRYEQHLDKHAFLRTCVVSGRRFTEVFDGSQIEDLTIATKVDTFEEGEVMLREGEMGDTFYIVKSGKVETYCKSGERGTIEEKKAFGTTSLLKGVVSPFTYKAASHVTLYYLTRQDFESILGSIQDALDGNTVTRSVMKSESKRTIKTSMSTSGARYDFELDDLEFFNVLGRGAFGQVTLVQAKKSKKVFALKTQSKHYIAKKGQKEHVLNEYRIMKEIEHPNILGIHCAIQDAQHLYFVIDLLPGGELMPYLVKRARMGKGFTEDITRFYAASVVLAFELLHQQMIAYRDLKPENIVLTKKGYGVVVDFGLAKEVDEGQTYTFCGTPDYLAPEIIRGTGHDWAVDYWGLGVFLFEMTNGTAPFYATNQARRTRKILKGFEYINLPSHFSGGLCDLISNLLIDDQSKRLGRNLNGVQGIINHRWFAGFDWEGFKEQTLVAPIQPTIPSDIKTIGKKKLDKNLFQEATYAPESDWWPDLKNIEQW
ncbi:hypothetical protein ACHAXR_005881 [Thalassiosira sp. AJA248-18]